MLAGGGGVKRGRRGPYRGVPANHLVLDDSARSQAVAAATSPRMIRISPRDANVIASESTLSTICTFINTLMRRSRSLRLKVAAVGQV